jgi:4-amino-4-deoxy-L-arabinose transferase-like glycosyltransferase
MIKIINDLCILIKRNASILFIFLFAILIRFYRINEHFIGFHDFNSAFFSIIAINHLRYGFLATKFLDVPKVFSGALSDNFYIDHPPLLGIVTSLSFRIFGVHEWSARLVPIVFSIGSLLIFYIIAKRCFDKRIALISSLFFALMPMTSYFGRIVCHEPLVLFFVLSSLYGYIRWFESRNWKWAFLMILCFMIGWITDWPAYLFVPLLLAHFIINKGFDIKSGRILFMLPFVALMFFLLLLYYFFIVNGTIDPLIGEFFVRTGSANFTFFQFLIKQLEYMGAFFSPFILLLSFVCIIRFVNDVDEFGRFNVSLILLLFSFGLLHVLIFKQGAWIHAYWLYYTSPAMALSAGLGLILIQSNELRDPQKLDKHYIYILLIFLIYFSSVVYLFNVWLDPKYWFPSSSIYYAIPGIIVALVSSIFTVNKKIGGWLKEFGFGRISTFIIILFLIFSVSITFWVHDWNVHEKYYDLGTMLNGKMKPDESFLATQAVAEDNPFTLQYYANRSMDIVYDFKYFDEKIKTPSVNYKYIVIERSGRDKIFENALLKEYNVIDTDRYYLIDLQNRDESY